MKSINMKSLILLDILSVAIAASVPTNKWCQQDVASDTFTNSSDVYYYYSEYDVSVCAEPMVGLPCIGEMYFTDLPQLEYVPYFVWYKIGLTGVNVWFKYNNTDAKQVNLGAVPCNNKQHSLDITKCDFGETLYNTGVFDNFTFSFDILCNVKKGVLDFNMNQTTHFNGELKSTFPFVWFKDWIVENNNPDFDTTRFFSHVRPIPPPDTPCKYCEKGVVIL